MAYIQVSIFKLHSNTYTQVSSTSTHSIQESSINTRIKSKYKLYIHKVPICKYQIQSTHKTYTQASIFNTCIGLSIKYQYSYYINTQVSSLIYSTLYQNISCIGTQVAILKFHIHVLRYQEPVLTVHISIMKYQYLLFCYHTSLILSHIQVH